jgi:hypothetical protein
MQEFRFKKMSKGEGSDGVEAARWLIEEQGSRRMKKSASETEALDSAGGKRADLAVEEFGEFELVGKLGDAITGGCEGKVIEPAEEH